MKKYISVSREALEKRIDKISVTEHELYELRNTLAQVKTLAEFNSEDMKLIDNTCKMLISKMENLENLLDDGNNEFCGDGGDFPEGIDSF